MCIIWFLAICNLGLNPNGPQNAVMNEKDAIVLYIFAGLSGVGEPFWAHV